MAGEKQGWDFEEGAELAPHVKPVQLLGGGTRAEAWLAWHERLHTLVVAKVLRPSHVIDQPSRDALAREARALRELQHPAIVRSFGAMLEGARPHLVLESLDGPRLSTLVRRYGPLAAEQLVPLGIEISSALAYMHDSGYVHLDVKPRNLIIGASPRLIDLGIARTSEELTALTAPIGTPAYMAPEQRQLETLDRLGPPADVWALGMVLHIAASGDRPSGDGISAMAGGRPLKDRLPAPLIELIGRCLAVDPGARPTAGDVVDELEPLLLHSRRVARRRLRARSR